MAPLSAVSLLILLAQAAPARPVDAPSPPGIEDNSFLVEEAYNQDAGVVQHIFTFERTQGGDRLLTFTQEWPVDRWPRHQLSYTLALMSANGHTGIGDLWLNWRYQAANSARVAVAPRVSISLPSGRAADGFGSGGAGLQLSLPVSVRAREGLVELHSNAGMTVVPRGTDPAGHHARTLGVALAQSVVWRPRPRVNPFVEFVWSRNQNVAGPAQTTWETSTVLDPGIRWSYDLAGGAQIVPGLAVPVDVSRPAGERWSVFAYFSIEHPFRGHHE